MSAPETITRGDLILTKETKFATGKDIWVIGRAVFQGRGFPPYFQRLSVHATRQKAVDAFEAALKAVREAACAARHDLAPCTCNPSPGPWHVQPSDHPGGLLIKPIPGQVVAQCDELPEMEANARLIAAAPELLDALRALYAACEMRANQEGGDFGPDVGPAAELADAAIAKAEGRAP